MKIPKESLLRSLQGVAVATKTSDVVTLPIAQWLTRQVEVGRGESAGLSLTELDNRLAATIDRDELGNEDSRELTKLVIATSFLRESCRQGRPVLAEDLDRCWQLVHSAITSTKLSRPDFFTASRSAQGFLAVPLCSLLEEGNIDQLIRLHVWLPGGKRGNPEFAVHSHQSFAQSWVLVGVGTDYSYEVEPAEVGAGSSPGDATHAAYVLAWDDGDGEGPGRLYKTHQEYSVVKNTGNLFKAIETQAAVHTRNMNYTVPANSFHRSVVAPDALHATLFFFDSHRGFVKDAGVLGPVGGKSFTQHRDPAGTTPAELAAQVGLVREWEGLMEEGRGHVHSSKSEDALRAFNTALGLCSPGSPMRDPAGRRQLVLGELGCTNRRFGRYETAAGILEGLVADMEPSELRVQFSGELGVTYRHMNRLEDAKRAFERQCATAKGLALDFQMCRALGNLGMVNFQLSQETDSTSLLDLAIEQLTERVAMARRLQAETEPRGSNGSVNESNRARRLNTLVTWEGIGLARLSICHYARGNVEASVATSYESLELTKHSTDPTVRAMSRFFHGRAILLQGRRKEALSLFNVPGTCSPAIALAKEPSDEHRAYMRELIEAGADMDVVDEHGYTALDHAVFNGDGATEALVLEGLMRNAEAKIQRRRAEARLRKGYREILQEAMRPILRAAGLASSGGGGRLGGLRRAYSEALAADGAKRGMFDGLRYMRWTEFKSFGRLPRSNHGLSREFASSSSSSSSSSTSVSSRGTEYLIFISYRWLNKTPGAPDDQGNTQYRRMVDAVAKFLTLHPSLSEEGLGVWMDYACVDQDEPASGVAALPMIIAQCDAMISLVDESYYLRAWCCVEVLMAQALNSSFGLHRWYEHVPLRTAGGGGAPSESWELRRAESQVITMSDKLLTYETDRSQVLFLERQSKLFG